jgi:hypothetical protein
VPVQLTSTSFVHGAKWDWALSNNYRKIGGVTDPRAQLILWFTAGVAIESLYLIRRNPGWLRFACCIGAGLAVAAYAAYKSAANGEADAQDVGYMSGLFAYVVLFGLLFTKEILPLVSEKLLLALTVIFWYGFAATFYSGTTAQNVLIVLAVVPSLITVYVALMRPALGFWLKLFLYTWFLTIVIAIGLFQFPYGNLQIFTVDSVPWINAADAVVTGMALMYLAVNALYLYLLIPIPGKSQSFADRMKEWHELTDLMTQRCAADEPTHLQALLIVATVGAVACLNYAFQLAPPALFISVTLMSCAFLLHVGTTDEVLRSAAAAELIGARSLHALERTVRSGPMRRAVPPGAGAEKRSR